MPNIIQTRGAVCTFVAAFLLATSGAATAQSGPTVYQDNYISVRAKIAEAGIQPVHIGDALSLYIEVVFDARQVQIENLDDDVFQRAFAGTPNIRLYEAGVIDTQTDSADQVRVMGHWRLQILDCPADMGNCPGNKSYELPTMTISYQLTDTAGSSADVRSARFRPWPGTIAVAAAIAVMPQAGTEISDILPGGAFAEPEPAGNAASITALLLTAGTLLFALGFIATMRPQHSERVGIRPHRIDTRWENALVRLRDDSLVDAEWSDLLRRCLTWYCVDELGRNPYTWLGAAASDAADQETSAARDFFLDVLHEESTERDKRGEYLNKLLELTGQNGSRSAAEPSA